MKKQILPLLVAVAVIAIIGGIFWQFLWISSQEPTSGQNDGPSPPANPVLTVTENPPELPAGYDVLVNNDPVMREDLKKKLTGQFYETIKSLQADPANSLLWYNLGSIKYSFEDFKGAEAAWKYAIQINPLAMPAHMNLATLYQYKIPNYPEAERLLRIVIEQNPQNVMRAYSELFDLYRYRYKEKTHLAESIMLEAYKKYPDQHAILKTIAWYYLEQKNTTKAKEYFERYLEKDPNDISAKEELDRLQSLQIQSDPR